MQDEPDNDNYHKKNSLHILITEMEGKYFKGLRLDFLYERIPVTTHK